MPDTLLGGIVINEILADPNGALNFDTDGNGVAESEDEFIELYNTSGAAINIGGLQLWDAGVGLWFTFPFGTMLAAGAHAMVISSVQAGGALPTGAPGDLFFDAGHGSPLINNTGDNVTLLDPSGAGTFIQARFNGDPLDDPTLGAGGYAGFPAGATRNGLGQDFGSDTDGQSLQRTGDGADVFSSDTPTPGTTNICFANGTQLLTPSGLRKVDALKVGDQVITADGTAKPIQWIYAKTWHKSETDSAPNLQPICILQGALGLNLPSRDLRLSQQHRVLVQGPIAKRMFGVDEVLVPAKALLALPGIFIEKQSGSIAYYHVMLAQHDILVAEGVQSESLYLGPQALSSIPQAALTDALNMLGLHISQIAHCKLKPARPLAPIKQARRLIKRHRRNDKPILADL